MITLRSGQRRLTRLVTIVPVCLVLAAPLPLFGQDNLAPDSSVAIQDFPTGTGLLTKRDLPLAAVIVGSLLAIEPLEGVDQSLRLEVSGAMSDRNTLPRRVGRDLGSLPVTVALTGGAFLAGWASGETALQRAGLHSLEALLLAEGSTQFIKLSVGRARPNISSDSDRFKPLRLGGDYNSFPSGHTSKAFAIAATFSSELREEAPWVPYVAYPVAAWVATTRVLDREHWLTDVVAGAALGILSSRAVEWLNHGRVRRGGLEWAVFPEPGGGVLLLVSAGSP